MKWRWKARKYDDAWSVVMRGPVDYEIATINGRREDPEAIARLVAAAPELLEALCSLVGCHHAEGTNCVHYRRAHRAIAKATGEGT